MKQHELIRHLESNDCQLLRDKGGGMASILAIIGMSVWPLFVVAAFGALSHLASGYYSYTAVFAIAAICHIPVFGGWVVRVLRGSARWSVAVIFAVAQSIILPTALRMILAG